MAQAHAQITLTANTSTPQIGDIVTFKATTINLSNFLESNTGINQTWDFSNLDDASTLEAGLEYTSTSNLTYPNLFPNCTLGGIDQTLQNSESYHETNSNGIRIAGAYIVGTDVIENTEGFHLLKFPMTLNTTYTDSIIGSTALLVTGGLEFDRIGISTITGDGFGDLILPYGTVHDVLRVKIEREYEDIFMGTSGITYTETSYYYYTDYNNNMIAATNHLTVSGTSMITRLFYQTQSSFTNLGSDQFTPNQDINLYPNPAVNHFTINNIEDNTMVEIIDLNGRVIKTVHVSSHTPIDISELSKGYYVVNIMDNNKTLVKKLIVQ